MISRQLRTMTAVSFLLVAPVGRSAVFEYEATLSGASEPPPTSSPATGFADVLFNDSAQTLEVKVTFSGLLGTTTASHIHAPTSAPFTGSAGVATTVPYFPGFPLGVNSGTYDHVLDLTSSSSYNPAFVTANGGTVAGAETALINALNEGRSYLNIHTTMFPGGEIAGYLTQVPESASTASLLLTALLVMASVERYRRGHTG
jgi:hypothetical protein